MRSLEHKMVRIKDSISIFYKRIEMIINPDDLDYNGMCRMFGYKSCLIKNNSGDHIMEVFRPILYEKGKRKLENKEKLL